MTPAELAARLGIPESQVTARGLLDHEFPGVVDCFPAGPSRDAFVNGLGEMLLRAGLDDSTAAGDTFRYEGQISGIRRVLSQPEMQGMLERCRRASPAPSNVSATPDGEGSTAPARLGAGTVALAAAILAGVGGMLWWVTRRTPEETARRDNPGAMPASTLGTYQWVAGNVNGSPTLFLQRSGTSPSPRAPWAEVFFDSRSRPTVLIYRENEQGGEKLVAEQITDYGWTDSRLRDIAKELNFVGLGHAMGIAEKMVASRIPAIERPARKPRRARKP